MFEIQPDEAFKKYNFKHFLVVRGFAASQCLLLTVLPRHHGEIKKKDLLVSASESQCTVHSQSSGGVYKMVIYSTRPRDIYGSLQFLRKLAQRKLAQLSEVQTPWTKDILSLVALGLPRLCLVPNNVPQFTVYIETKKRGYFPNTIQPYSVWVYSWPG